jgi:hypothetical protein
MPKFLRAHVHLQHRSKEHQEFSRICAPHHPLMLVYARNFTALELTTPHLVVVKNVVFAKGVHCTDRSVGYHATRHAHPAPSSALIWLKRLFRDWWMAEFNFQILAPVVFGVRYHPLRIYVWGSMCMLIICILNIVHPFAYCETERCRQHLTMDCSRR